MVKQDAGNSDENAEIALLKAKIAFIKASDNVSPFSIVDRRPLTSLGCAFLLGFGLRALTPLKKDATLVASVAEIGGIVSRLLPLVYSRASSSGG